MYKQINGNFFDFLLASKIKKLLHTKHQLLNT